MTRLPIVLHVGLHKTATSFLQRRVFPRLQGIDFAGSPPALGQTFKLVASLVRPGVPLLLSDEGLSGYPFRGRWMEEFEESVRGLSVLFPDARVIVGFRAHRPWVISLYKQYLNKGGTLTLPGFLGLEGGEGVIRRGDTSFGRRLDLLDEAFPGRVFVYTQEEIAATFDSFLVDLCAFLGVPPPEAGAIDIGRENVGVRGLQARLLRRLNGIDAVLRKATVLPTLNNRIFERLGLHPRGLCQKRLAGIRAGAPLELPEAAESWTGDWAADWARVQAARDARGEVVARAGTS